MTGAIDMLLNRVSDGLSSYMCFFSINQLLCDKKKLSFLNKNYNVSGDSFFEKMFLMFFN